MAPLCLRDSFVPLSFSHSQQFREGHYSAAEVEYTLTFNTPKDTLTYIGCLFNFSLWKNKTISNMRPTKPLVGLIYLLPVVI